MLRRERVLERLHAVYEEGCVVPIPFLRAADAVPQALLDDLRAPYLPPGAYAPPLVRIYPHALSLSHVTATVRDLHMLALSFAPLRLELIPFECICRPLTLDRASHRASTHI